MGTPFDLFQGVNKGFWAGGAGAPVDTLTLALNALIAGGGYAGHKMGLLNTPPELIEKPVGGSEWIADKMRSRGLLQDNPGSTADNIGNVLGGLLGPVTAAKAPQIARGLLQGGENLASPRTLNPQTGAIVWHGSPHKFDKFDSSKIGTGEGAQAYGHGLYLAESPAVAGQYADTLGVVGAVDNGGNQIGKTGVVSLFSKALKEKGLSDAAALSQATQWADNFIAGKPVTHSIASGVVQKNGLKAAKDGSLYKVDLPDSAVAKMLDWDKPLSQQPEVVKQALGGIESKFPEIADFNLRKWMDADPLASTWHNVLQRDLGADPAMITSTLKERGIPGIRYLDGGSRSAGQGSSNFVVFPGNEGLLSILERNGAPIK